MSKLLPKGHLSVLSKAFKYTPAASTDVARTFARVRRELKAAEVQQVAGALESIAASRPKLRLRAIKGDR